MKKKNGFTVVELIVSFALVMIVVYFLFQIILALKEMYVSNATKSVLLNKQAIINEKIYEDFRNKEIKIASNCGNNCLVFIFSDNTSSVLKVDTDNKTFHYGDYTTKLEEGSSFGSMSASIEKISTSDATKYDSILIVKIPITNLLLDGDYGVNAIYQYNSHLTSIGNVTLENSSGSTIYLKGDTTMTVSLNGTYNEPGYFTLSSENAIIDNDSRVKVTNSINTKVSGTYTVTYELITQNVTVEKKTRTVIVK